MPVIGSLWDEFWRSGVDAKCVCVRDSKCSSCGSLCDIPSYEDIGFLIDNCEHYILETYNRVNSFSGYDTRGSLSWTPGDGERNIDTLMDYLSILRDMNRSLILKDDNPCLCNKYYLSLKDKIVSITGIVKDGVGSQVKKQPTEEWLLNNPGMTTFERWERALYQVPHHFVFEIQEVVKEKPVVNFDIIEKTAPVKEVIFEIVEKVSTKKKIEFTIEEKKILSKHISFDVIEKIQSKGIDFCVVEKAIKNKINFIVQEGCLNVITEQETLINL